MAIASCSVRVISRGKGRSAVAAAAYRSCEKIRNAYDGLMHDYTRKRGLVHSEILVPVGAPEWTHQRADLWNNVEHFERRKDARLAREVMVALPCELTDEQNVELTRAYARTFVNQGMVADVSVHNAGDGNPHAHILLTDRPLDGGVFSKKKNSEWNKDERVTEWREAYERVTNQHLERYGHEERIDVRSYAEQGVDKIPTIHMGQGAWHMEERGIQTERGNINRGIQEANRDIEKINSEINALEREKIQEAQREAEPLKAAQRQRERQEQEAMKTAVLQPSPQPEHHARPFPELPARGTERPEDTKPPPLPHRHPEGRTWSQHRHAALEHGRQREAAGRDQPPPLHRHFESRSPAQPHRTPQEPERTETPEPSGENRSHHSRIENNHMRRMVSPEAETLAKQQKTESDKLPEKEQDHVRPTSPGGGRKLGFRDLRETLKKEHEQEKEEELDRSSRDRPDRKR